MKRAATALAVFTALACSVDSGTAPTTDVIPADEKAAVQQALASSFGDDTVYAALSGFVLPFVDQATPQPNAAGDTTRVAGFQLEAVAGVISGGVSGVLAWRGYRAASGTVDSIFLVVGAGVDPGLNDSLSDRFAFNLLGSGTAWVIAEAPDSTVQTWLSRTGALTVPTVTFSDPTTVDLGGGLSVTKSRGSMTGNYHLTARLVPDSSTTTATSLDFGAGAASVKVQVMGQLPQLTARRRAPEPSPAPNR
jgi:hypothetical protein